MRVNKITSTSSDEQARALINPRCMRRRVMLVVLCVCPLPRNLLPTCTSFILQKQSFIGFFMVFSRFYRVAFAETLLSRVLASYAGHYSACLLKYCRIGLNLRHIHDIVYTILCTFKFS